MSSHSERLAELRCRPDTEGEVALGFRIFGDGKVRFEIDEDMEGQLLSSMVEVMKALHRARTRLQNLYGVRCSVCSVQRINKDRGWWIHTKFPEIPICYCPQHRQEKQR
jgi:hypothetical protein